MQRSAPIANETEFQEWLAAVFESECKRLREEAGAREFPKVQEFGRHKENYTKETPHHEDEW
jgi:hypothetical protein